ncbi:MAG: cupin domain-containing protein, partial [Hyperionvirus sp.]
FSQSTHKTVDLPVAFNGIPVPIRAAYTNSHSELLKWKGVIFNPVFAKSPIRSSEDIASPYRIKLSAITPLFDDKNLGSVIVAVKDNWPIINKISFLRIILKPNTARDPIWWPDVNVLYNVTRGSAQFLVITSGTEPRPFIVNKFDFIFIPMGELHTFSNLADEDFEIVAFFSKDNPQAEVSLLDATAFFPENIANYSLTKYAHCTKSCHGTPLKDLKHPKSTPYILRINP